MRMLFEMNQNSMQEHQLDTQKVDYWWGLKRRNKERNGKKGTGDDFVPQTDDMDKGKHREGRCGPIHK